MSSYISVFETAHRGARYGLIKCLTALRGGKTRWGASGWHDICKGVEDDDGEHVQEHQGALRATF